LGAQWCSLQKNSGGFGHPIFRTRFAGVWNKDLSETVGVPFLGDLIFQPTIDGVTTDNRFGPNGRMTFRFEQTSFVQALFGHFRLAGISPLLCISELIGKQSIKTETVRGLFLGSLVERSSG